mmetsp:Transcript_6152/g.19301  ORF Transcript_6152/g.19301 Transcript_6152/m.19301 type:complete len:203 (-) Transcript_6152:246-854(-)
MGKGESGGQRTTAKWRCSRSCSVRKARSPSSSTRQQRSAGAWCGTVSRRRAASSRGLKTRRGPFLSLVAPFFSVVASSPKTSKAACLAAPKAVASSASTVAWRRAWSGKSVAVLLPVFQLATALSATDLTRLPRPPPPHNTTASASSSSSSSGLSGEHDDSASSMSFSRLLKRLAVTSSYRAFVTFKRRSTPSTRASASTSA